MRIAKRKTARHQKVMVVKRMMTKTLGTPHPKQASTPKWETTQATEGCTPRDPRVLTPANLTRMPRGRPVADSPLQLSPLVHSEDTAHGIKWKWGQWS
jgi:hypothetical protein